MKTTIDRFVDYKANFRNSKKLSEITLLQIVYKEINIEPNDAMLIPMLEQEREDISKIIDILYSFLRFQKEKAKKIAFIDAIDELIKQKELLDSILSDDSAEKKETQKQASENIFKKVQSSIKSNRE